MDAVLEAKEAELKTLIGAYRSDHVSLEGKEALRGSIRRLGQEIFIDTLPDELGVFREQVQEALAAMEHSEGSDRQSTTPTQGAGPLSKTALRIFRENIRSTEGQSLTAYAAGAALLMKPTTYTGIERGDTRYSTQADAVLQNLREFADDQTLVDEVCSILSTQEDLGQRRTQTLGRRIRAHVSKRREHLKKLPPEGEPLPKRHPFAGRSGKATRTS